MLFSRRNFSPNLPSSTTWVRRCRRAAAQALPVLALLLAGPLVPARAGVGPTVKDVVEMTRVIQPHNHDDGALQTQVSPDREQAFLVTRKPDVSSDVNRYELLWLDLSPKRLASGADFRAVPPVTLLNIDARQDHDENDPALRDVRWMDDRTLVFRARLNDQPFQVYRFDVPTRKLTQLTHAPLGLHDFDVSRDLQRVVYVAPVLAPAVHPGARSVVVGTNSFWNVHFGHLGVRNQQRRMQYMVTEAGSRLPARALGDSFPEVNKGSPTPSMSPDGRWVVLPRYDQHRQKEWAAKYPMIAESLGTYAASRTMDPLGYYSRPLTYVARRLALFRLDDGAEQVILDAPDDSDLSTLRRTDRMWQDGGQSLVIAGTFLPVDSSSKMANAASSAPSASHIVEYWPATGRWNVIATMKVRLKELLVEPGRPRAFIAVDGAQRRSFERLADGVWREGMPSADGMSGRAAQPVGPTGATATEGASWRLKIHEALNQPPELVALTGSGKAVRLTDLNPQYSPASWGTMNPYDWKDAKGRTWRGGLMVPADFNPKARHALVIQTYGFEPTRFYRDGSNRGDGYTSGFPGRAFMREGILVLAVPIFPPDAGITTHREKLDAIQDGVRAAIERLVESGLVDREKIGIIGWSASGEQVLNLVTFTDIPIRSASMVDGDANTLFSMTVTYSVLDGTQVRKERVNGGGPYGQSLSRWIESDPSLHTDCVKAAMRIETYGPEVHNNWDVYALLRRQYKPAELIFMPEGTHGLLQPSERMISLQGNVDWHAFWLKGARRTEVVIPGETSLALKDQYVRWDQMLDMKRVDDARPACARKERPQ